MEPPTEDKKPANHWLQWLLASDRRKAKRRQVYGLVAYYWDGGAPVAHGIGEISSTGMYLLTDQRWYRGTLLTMTLQRTDIAGMASPERSIAVQAKVVRVGKDGVGFAFALPEAPSSSRAGGNSQNQVADRKTFHRFMERLTADRITAD